VGRDREREEEEETDRQRRKEHKFRIKCLSSANIPDKKKNEKSILFGRA